MPKRAHIEDGNAMVIGFEDEKGRRMRLPDPLPIPEADAMDFDPEEVESFPAKERREIGWDWKLKRTKAK